MLRSGAKPDHSWRSGAWFSTLLACELLANLAANWPVANRFRFIAFEDGGGSLLVQRLLALGLQPSVDFFYPYGLLPLLAARGWFAVFGQTVHAQVAFTTCCNLLIAWGLARFATALRAPLSACLVLAVATPLVIRPAYLNVTHALEAVLMVHALAAHARGERGTSLALVVACAFVKASMAYVYGLLLLLLLGRKIWQTRGSQRIEWRRELGPAVAIGLTCGAALLACFGPRALLGAQIPNAGGKAYALMNYGFFRGVGRNFWAPPGATLNYYLGRFSGTWLVCTALLLVANARMLAGLGLEGHTELDPLAKPEAPPATRREMLAVTLILHAMFVCFFYGVAWDWGNYAYILVLGVVSSIRAGRAGSWLSAVLVCLMLLVHVRSARDELQNYRELSPSAETAQLWATAEEREEWTHVLDITRGRRPLMFKMSGVAELLFPGIEATSTWYVLAQLLELLPASEYQRLLRELGEPRDIVVHEEVRRVLELPAFQRAMAGHALSWRGHLFDVYRPTPAAALE